MAGDPRVDEGEGDRGYGAALTRKEQLIEVLVFLFLVMPSLILSLFAPVGSVSFVLTAWATILRDLALVGLILFFVWRNGEPVAQVGWTSRHAGRDIILGLVLSVPLFLGAGLLDQALQTAGFSAPSVPLPSALMAKGWSEFVLAFVLVLVVAVAEETIFRGYLILRFAAVTRSPAWAVALSALIFAVGHGYEGSAGLVTVGVVGLVLALVYVWRRSLVAPIVMHFVLDFVSIVLLPLLTGA